MAQEDGSPRLTPIERRVRGAADVGGLDDSSYRGTISSQHSDVSAIRFALASEDSGIEEEAEEEENESSAELSERQQEAEKEKQEEPKNLEKELRQLNDRLRNPSLSDKERAEILNKMQEIQGKIHAIRPPQIRPANHQRQGQPHQQPQSLGQQTAGAQPAVGFRAASGGGAGAGVGRGGGSSAGGEANSARLVKSGGQQIRDSVKKIKKELDADKESIARAHKTYWEEFSRLFRDRDPNAMAKFEALRQQALGALEVLGERNQLRSARLDKLLEESLKAKPGKSIDQKFLDSITDCTTGSSELASRLGSIKNELEGLTPAEFIRKELSQRPNILTRHSGQAIRVH